MKMESHLFSSEIVKECDIRGIVGENLRDSDAYFIGRSFGTILKRRDIKRCVIGYDGRVSSPRFCVNAIKGLTETGVDVINIGLVPTPVVYFAVNKLYPGGGIIITASHNPPEYNGFKFITSGGPFHAEDLQELSEVNSRMDFEKGSGNVKTEDILPVYGKYLMQFLEISSGKEFSIVWDPGNGSAAVTLPLLLKYLPGRHTVICGEVDGAFPNHHPDPSLKKNVEMLQMMIRQKNADFGIAFDGDGDRIGVVDSEGYLLQGDQLLVIYARDFLKKNPSATVMSEVKASSFLYNEISSLGGNPFMWKVGHTNQKKKMKEQRIQLAGETSGHIFFGENGGYDDALFAAIKLVNILSKSRKSLTEIRKGFPVLYDSGEIRIPLKTAERKRVVAEVTERMKISGRRFISIDGIRVFCGSGFWLVRGSNTQPHLTIRCEAASKKDLEKCIDDLKKQLSLSGVTWKNEI